MKIYLAGPMRGKPCSNFAAFDYAAYKLRAQGHEVFSPADHDRSLGLTGEDEAAAIAVSRDLFDADTHYICKEAHAIALLPGWEQSEGATAENALAKALGLTRIILGREYVQ
jgi:hypothetical protein